MCGTLFIFVHLLCDTFRTALTVMAVAAYNFRCAPDLYGSGCHLLYLHLQVL